MTPRGSGRSRFRARIVGTDESELSSAIFAVCCKYGVLPEGFTTTELICKLSPEMQTAFAGCKGTVRGLGASLRRVVLGLLKGGRIVKTGERASVLSNLGRAAHVYRITLPITSAFAQEFHELWARHCHKFFVLAPVSVEQERGAASGATLGDDSTMVLSIGGHRVTIVGAKSVSVD